MLVLANPLIAHSPTIPNTDKLTLIQENTLKAFPMPHLWLNLPVLGVLVVEDDPNLVKINKLNLCENHGLWDENRILDVNGKYSYGGLQFQLNTFRTFGIKYGVLPSWITNQNIIEEKLIYDRGLQTQIALRMIEEKVAHQHWVRCWRKMNLSYEK